MAGTTTNEQLEALDKRLGAIDDQLKLRNKYIAVAIIVLAVGLWALWDRQADADRASDERVEASCKQQNRAFRDYTNGLVRASGGDPRDPAIGERLAQLPRRQCTPQGIHDYFNNAPQDADDEKCRGDGKGYCLHPTTTTSVPK